MNLTCDGCGKRVGVTKDDGVIHVLNFDLETRRQALMAWEVANPAEGGWTPTSLVSHPSRVRWATHCNDCNPHLDEDGSGCHGCYWIDAIRANTPARLLHWTAHLMEKRWLKHTNWNEFIRPFGDDA